MMSDRIKEERIRLGLTQEELAARLGLQKSAIAKYENGRVTNIKRETIGQMAKLFECSPTYLLGFDEDDFMDTSFSLSSDEEAHIIKYRALDDYGQNTVDVVLNIQYERCIKEHSKNTEDEPKSNIITPTFSEPTPEYGVAKAAHATKGASKEHYQESEDILNNADRRSHDIDC